jgi:RNA polymerase sigma factor (sigma-70 family)
VTADQKYAFLTALEKTHGSQLRRFLAMRMRNSASDVSDLVQEVFLRLLRIDDHESIRNPQAYLYTIASHVLYQYALRQSATPETLDQGDLASDIRSATFIDPAVQVELEQRFEDLGRGLKELSPRAYATLILHRCDGVPLKDIAARFGVSRTMVKRYLARALSYCQQRLDEE